MGRTEEGFVIEFKNLRKSFGDREVLRGIDLGIRRGEILFILGTSGTGKSVLLKNLVGLLRPSLGEVWIAGQEVSRLSEVDYQPIRRRCGMVFQHPALFDSLTIFENVAFGLRRHFRWPEEKITTRVRECLSLVHLSGVENLLPQDLSYGMQKRASLARTLAVGPEILLFDEPTTGLDPITTNAVNELIRELSEKLDVTSVIVSHDMPCALAIAHKIVVLDQGKIVEQGTPSDLLRSKNELVQDFLREAVENGAPGTTTDHS